MDNHDLMQTAMAAVTGLVVVVWGFLKSDISRANAGVERCLVEVRILYGNAEKDREKTRDLIDARADRLSETISDNQREVMKVLGELKNKTP